MFSRFKQNVRMYPRTAAVMGALYLGAILGSIITGIAMHLSTGRELLTLAALVGLVAFVDLLTYLWVTGDPGRLRFLLEVMNDFEGRATDLIDDEEGQDVAEYAVMLAVILVIAIGTIHLIGSNAANAISAVGSQIQ